MARRKDLDKLQLKLSFSVRSESDFAKILFLSFRLAGYGQINLRAKAGTRDSKFLFSFQVRDWSLIIFRLL